MGIRIEIDTDRMALPEWQALAAFVAVMTGGELIAPDAEKIADKMIDSPAVQAIKAELAEEDRARRELPVTVKVAHTVPSGPLSPIGQIITSADNPATGTDPDLASFGVGNAPGGTAMVASPAAVPAVGGVPSLPPAMPPAPPAPVTVVALPASNALLDVRGLPWDHRIHSGEKTQNKDGSWRNKRGLADGLVETVEAELRAVMAIPSGAPVFHPAPVGAPPPPPTDTGPITFLKLMPKVTGAIKSGQTTQEHVNAVLKQFGFPHLPAVNTRPDLLQAVHDGIFGAA